MDNRPFRDATARQRVPATLFRRTALVLSVLAPLVAGCTARNTGESDTQNHLADVTIRLSVVDDAAMAAAVRSLQGEWESRTDGGRYRVEELASADLSDRATLDSDAIIYPSHLLGPLVQRGLLAPLSAEQLSDERLQWGEVFELLRRREAAWGSTTYALPFGSPVFVCYYRADLFQRVDRQAPRTWSEYQKLAEFFSDRAALGDLVAAEVTDWFGTAEPLADGWAAVTLLARAAPYASHRGHYSTLFDFSTMQPLIDGPPFVRALEELVAASRQGPADPFRFDPGAARRAFWQGKCAMALAWPTSAGSGAADLEPAQRGNVRSRLEIDVGFVELPGSGDVFNVSEQTWEIRREDEGSHVPLLSVAGRAGSVARDSDIPEAAFELLLWLSGPEWSAHVAADSEATTMFRTSHRDRATAWVEPQVSETAAIGYAQVVEATLSRQQAVVALRIPGREAYLAALDEAVRRAVSREQTAAEALQQVAARWEEITDELGREKQGQAYRKSLGL